MRLNEQARMVELPSTRVAEGAWDSAVRRVRRRRVAVVVIAPITVLAVVAATNVIAHNGDQTPPIDTPVASTSPTEPQIVTRRMGMPSAYEPQTFERLVGETIRPPADAIALSESPISYAKLAMTRGVDSTEILVLGQDDKWRQLDVPLETVDDGSGYVGSPFRSTSLSPDASMLALPQRSSLVVVDLTDGSHRTYRVPADYLVYANWLSDSRVVVASESSSLGWEVDLDEGSVSRSQFGPSTASAPDGRLVTWGMGSDGFSTTMEWDNGQAVSSDYNNTAGFHPTPPLVNDAIVVGHHITNRTGLGLPLLQNAIVVVDRSTGAPLAYLPTMRAKGDLTTLLGWDDGKIVLSLVGHPISESEYTMALAEWDWKEGTLEPLITLAGGSVAWGHGW